MAGIYFIQKDTDLSKVLHPLHWDVCIGNTKENIRDYKAFLAYEDESPCREFKHTIGGHTDNVWCCPRDEEPSFENLIPFNGTACRWDVCTNAHNYVKDCYGDNYVENKCEIVILRNWKKFKTIYSTDITLGIAKALTLIEDYKSHPLNLNDYRYEENCVGREIRYKGIRAKVVKFVDEACVGIRPVYSSDNDEFYKNPHNIEEEYIEDYYEEAKDNNILTVDINSQFIWWWAD